MDNEEEREWSGVDNKEVRRWLAVADECGWMIKNGAADWWWLMKGGG